MTKEQEQCVRELIEHVRVIEELAKTLFDGNSVNELLSKINKKMGQLEATVQEEQETSEEFNETELEWRVTKLLHELGIPAHIRGYHYLRDAIIMSVKDSEYLKFITKKLYPDVAIKNKTTSSKVERAMRHAIEVAWSRGNIVELEKYFAFSFSPEKGKATNSEFISMVVDHIKLEMKKKSRD